MVALTVNTLTDDQGIYTFEPDARGDVPNADALVIVGLERAHEPDDVPHRELLHRIGRRVEIWRVESYDRKPIVDRDWPDGTASPGIKMVSFVQRLPEIGHEQFVRHWTEQHTPLALRHHVGMWRYCQNVVRRAFTPGGREIDGIAELHFRTREDFEQRFYDSDAGLQAIRDDVKRFIARVPMRSTALMEELVLRSAPGGSAREGSAREGAAS